MPEPAAPGRGGLDSWVERNRWLPHNPHLFPSRSCLQNRAWGLLSKFSSHPGEMPLVWAVALGWAYWTCRGKLNLQAPTPEHFCTQAASAECSRSAPQTSSLPKLQIQTSQTLLWSLKSLYIPTLTLCRQQQFQSCFLSELLTNSEPGSAPRVGSLCWFVSGQPEGAQWNWSGASAVQVWSWWGRKGSQGKHRQGLGRRDCPYGIWLPASPLRLQIQRGDPRASHETEHWHVRKKNG